MTNPLWKTEGPTDLMALLSVNPDADAFTTANGAKEKPLDWIVQRCKDRTVYVVHDADKPGQEGATTAKNRDGLIRPGWCPTLAKSAKEVRNVTLPFTVAPTNGPDLRDYLTGGSTFDDLLERANDAEVFTADDGPAVVDEHEDDPQRLARVNLERYKSEHDGSLLFYRDEWWKWKAGRYRKIENGDLKAKVWAAIRTEFEHCWRERRASGENKKVAKVTRALVSNVVGAMESVCSLSASVPMPCWLPDRSTPHYIAATNGIVDMEAVFAGKSAGECLKPHTPDWFSSFRLDYPFDAEADCPKWVQFIASAMEHDAERIAILQQWAGYLLTGRNNFQKFLALEGEGGNGKTVYFAGMTAMLGQDNVSHVALERFGGQFDLGSTIGKAANICGDVGEIDGVAEAELKQFTGGDVMQVDRKNREPISIRPSAKLMMSWNRAPKFRDRSDGLWRRMLLVPFNYVPSESEIVRGMDNAEWWVDQGEASGMLLWAIEGLRQLREQGGFTQSRVSVVAVNGYRTAANPAMEFLTEYLTEEPGGKVSKQRLYEVYCHFCKKTGIRFPLAQRAFGREVKKVFPSAIDSKITIGSGRENAYQGFGFTAGEVFSMNTDPNENLF